MWNLIYKTQYSEYLLAYPSPTHTITIDLLALLFTWEEASGYFHLSNFLPFLERKILLCNLGWLWTCDFPGVCHYKWQLYHFLTLPVSAE